MHKQKQIEFGVPVGECSQFRRNVASPVLDESNSHRILGPPSERFENRLTLLGSVGGDHHLRIRSEVPQSLGELGGEFGIEDVNYGSDPGTISQYRFVAEGDCECEVGLHRQTTRRIKGPALRHQKANDPPREM
jgi:hypothetical protein